jgi:recombinational DNA repair ATPase RecF
MSRINHLQLKGFRCWEALDWAPGGDVHLLVGDNGVGKTSILEAIFLCLSLRPAHGVRWRELIPQGAEHGFVGAELEGAAGLQSVRIGFDRFARRLRVDDQAPRSASAFAVEHPVVFFRPGDLGLVQGGPKGRRRLLDTIVELEEAMLLFRSHHARMVERMIGRRMGTGGTSGVDYLDMTLKYRIFTDLWAVRTILVKRELLDDIANPQFYGFAA